MVEVNDREHNSDFLTQLQQQSQQRYRIGSARNRNSRPITGLEKPLPANVLKHALSQFAHAQCYIRGTASVAPGPCPERSRRWTKFGSPHHPIQIRKRNRALKSLVRSRALQFLR